MKTEQPAWFRFGMGTITGFCLALTVFSGWKQVGDSWVSVQVPVAYIFSGFGTGLIVCGIIGRRRVTDVFRTSVLLVSLIYPFVFYFFCRLISEQVGVIHASFYGSVVFMVIGFLFGFLSGSFFKGSSAAVFRDSHHLIWGYGAGLLFFFLVQGRFLPLTQTFSAGVALLIMLLLPGGLRGQLNYYFVLLCIFFHLTALYYITELQDTISRIPSSGDIRLIDTVPTRLGILNCYSRGSTHIVSLDASPFYWENLELIEREFYTHIPLLASSNTGPDTRVLLIGYGSGMYVREILKHAVGEVDYYDFLSPIRNVFKSPFPDIFSLPGDTRLHFRTGDPWVLSLVNRKKYDIILLAPVPYGHPSESRFFTRGGFRLLSWLLKPDGILACYPHSLLSMPHADYMNGMFMKTLSSVFPSIRIISTFRPVNESSRQFESPKCSPLREIVLASHNPAIERIDHNLLIASMNEKGVRTTILTPRYIEAAFALSDVSGEITYDSIDFKSIKISSLDARQFPWFNYQNYWPSRKPIDYVEFGIGKTTDRVEARIFLQNKEVLIRRKE